MDFWITLLAVCMLVYGSMGETLQIVRRTRLGNDVKLPCPLSSGDSHSDIRWSNTKHGLLSIGTKTFKLRNRIEIEMITSMELALVIKNVEKSFADVYTCASGTTPIAIVTLKIEVAPKIDTSKSTLSEVSFPESSNATLTCAFTGEPAPEITWFRGDPNPKAIGITGAELTIPAIARYATDVYTCRGSNTINEYDYHINVTVTFEPVVHVMEEKVYSNLGVAVALACMVQASPIYDAHWTSPKGEKIPSKSNWKYYVKNERAGNGIPMMFLSVVLRASTWGVHDYGDYKCHARGETSTVIKTVKLIDQAKKPINYD